MDTFLKLASNLSNRRGVSLSAIRRDTKFSQLELDSLEMLDLVLEMEEDFSVSIELRDDLDTVGRVADYIDGKITAV